MTTNSTKVAEIQGLVGAEDEAAWVANLWDKYNHQRQGKINEWQELKAYIYATDTTTTSNQSLPWKNSTTLPKLTQIRDNLHSNYISSLFPNDKWLQWQAFSEQDAQKNKSKAITAYMDTKAREGGLRTEVGKMLLDYIDFGNAFAMPSFERRYKVTEEGTTAGFIGPRAVRINPLDIVFNPLAASLHDTHKIIRSRKTIGELKRLAQTNPDHTFWEDVIEKRLSVRERMGGYSTEDFEKAVQFSIDGFGSIYEYFQSDDVEILEFYGDYYDNRTGVLKVNQMITVVDRSWVARSVDIPTYDGTAPIFHVGWRTRSDNLWAMGPLDNLVGLQYRLDHLENLTADAMDLLVHPPLKIIGEVEEFVWAPGVKIAVDEGGADVQEVAKNVNGIFTAQSAMENIEDRMELYAGAPREAMGVRTPGEKTAFEVQALENAAGRIFQEKITHFEIELLEPLLNSMLEVSRRNMDSSDIVRTIDNDIGVQEFLTLTKEDITAKGILRPVGARHFAQRAQDLQNLVGIFNSPLGQTIAPHTSSKALTKFIEDTTDLRGYKIFRPNIAIIEAQETQGLVQQSQEDLEVDATGPVEDDIDVLAAEAEEQG